MKLFLDCEFTRLNRDTKLISLALVSEAGHEYYVELTDTYVTEDCSDFVIQNVLPQLNLAAADLGRSSILTTCFPEQPERPPRGLLGRAGLGLGSLLPTGLRESSLAR